MFRKRDCIFLCIFLSGIRIFEFLDGYLKREIVLNWQVIAREARDFKLGESLYYVVVVFTAIIWQAFFVGAIGLIFCASSLVSGLMISVLLPVTVILAVICFREKFQAGKGVALVLSLWGSVSYFYGQIKSEEKTKAQETHETQLSQLPVTNSVA